MFNRHGATVIFLAITRKLMKPAVLDLRILGSTTKTSNAERIGISGRRGEGWTDNQPMRLRRFAHIPRTHAHAHIYARARANRVRVRHGELATRVRIGPFPVPVQGYPRSLCSKTLAINLRGGLGSERERERAATWPRRAARIVSLVA